jgi:hypothetical protein
MLVSLTPAADRSFIPEARPEAPKTLNRLPLIGRLYRIARLHEVYANVRTDGLKRALFSVPVHLYGRRNRAEFPDRVLVGERAHRIVARVPSPGFLTTFATGLARNGPAAALNYALTTPLALIPTPWRRRLKALIRPADGSRDRR